MIDDSLNDLLEESEELFLHSGAPGFYQGQQKLIIDKNFTQKS